MPIQINLPASLANAERVFKYYIDPLHPETHGWYLYELDEVGSNSYTRNMTDAISPEEGDIYLLDDTTPNNVLRGGAGSEHILITSGLKSNITIRNHFLATDKILFTQDVAVSKINAIHLLPNVPATPIIQIILTLDYKVITDGQPSAETGKLTIFLPIIGTEAADDITANERDNIIEGLAGDDRLEGGGGNNVLNGGDGRDIFEYTISTIGGLDIIENFTAGDDKMQFYKFKTEDVCIASGHGEDILENEYGDNTVEDAIIYDTKGTSDLSDDIAFLILTDYDADDLTMNESGNYLVIV